MRLERAKLGCDFSASAFSVFGIPPFVVVSHPPSPTAMSFYLAVVSPNDAPLFELAFSSTKPPPPATAASTSSFPSWSAFTTSSSSSSSSIIGGGGDAASHDAARPTTSGPLMESKSAPQRDRAMCQMVAHMSLDSVEEIMEGTGALYAHSLLLSPQISWR